MPRTKKLPGTKRGTPERAKLVESLNRAKEGGGSCTVCLTNSKEYEADSKSIDVDEYLNELEFDGYRRRLFHMGKPKDKPQEFKLHMIHKVIY